MQTTQALPGLPTSLHLPEVDDAVGVAGRRRLKRLWVQLTGLLIGLLTSFMLLFGLAAWNFVENECIQDLHNTAKLVKKTLDTFFAQEEAGLRQLAQELQDREGLGDRVRAQHLLARYKAARPELASANLLNIEGQFLASSLTPSLNSLPSLAGSHAFQATLDRLAREPDLRVDISQPALGAISKKWVFSMRMVLRNAQGDPTHLLLAVMPVELISSFWSDIQASRLVSIGLLRDDGYLLSRHPLPPRANFDEVYGKPRTGALRQHLVAQNFPKSGFVIGPNALGGGNFGNAYLRLEQHPLTLFAATPESELHAQWLDKVLLPFTLSGLLMGLVLLFSRLSLARQLAWDQKRQQADAALRTQEEEQRFVFEHLQAGLVVHAPDGSALQANPLACLLWGLQFSPALGCYLPRPGWQQLREDGAPLLPAEFPAVRLLASGQAQIDQVVGVRPPDSDAITWLLCRANAAQEPDGQLRRIIVSFIDISDRIQAQRGLEAAGQNLARINAQLQTLAHFDPLTHLPNRVLLADRLQQAMGRAQRQDVSVAVAFLDLDGFKAINDAHGHVAGDLLLTELAQRMKLVLREGDTLARLGGDEFVAVICDFQQPSDCLPILARLLEVTAAPVWLDGVSVQVSASIGVTVYPQDGADADQLLRHADQAMYRAKQTGKNCFHLFDVANDTAVKSRQEEIERIRQGLERGEFVLFYQPKVNLRSGRVVGFEALIRWRHPERGLLAPGAFLPLLQAHPVGLQIGAWVLVEALAQLERWGLVAGHAGEAGGLPISVNIAAEQLQDAGFPDQIEALLAARPQLPRQLLELEILETSALEDIEQVSSVMRRMQALGVGFALDDFGTGYSSLTYLKRLPAQLLKIDQSFVRDMLVDKDDLAIVQGIVGLARNFGRDVIAEGVETQAHGERLLALGCELAQGYGIARPMPAAEVPTWVGRWQQQAVWTA